MVGVVLCRIVQKNRWCWPQLTAADEQEEKGEGRSKGGRAATCVARLDSLVVEGRVEREGKGERWSGGGVLYSAAAPPSPPPETVLRAASR